MAGLLDGEGTIGITANGGENRTPYVSVTSTTREIIDWLHTEFDGHISIQKVYQAHYKQSWSWKLRNKSQLFELLINVIPYMKEPEKIRRGNMLLNEYNLVTVRNGKYTVEQKLAKLDFEDRFLHPTKGNNEV